MLELLSVLMCGGGPSPAPAPIQRQPALQPAVTPTMGAKKKTTRQTPASGIGTPRPSVLSGLQGVGDEFLNLGGKTILGG